MQAAQKEGPKRLLVANSNLTGNPLCWTAFGGASLRADEQALREASLWRVRRKVMRGVPSQQQEGCVHLSSPAHVGLVPGSALKTCMLSLISILPGRKLILKRT